MKNKLIALLTMGALAVGTLAGCGNTAAADTAASAADTAAETPAEAVSTAADEVADTNADSADKYADLSGSVSMSGSTSMEKLANAVAESFMEKYPNVTVTAEFTGSSAGIESVLAGSVDIGNSSRNLKDDEKSAGAAENIVAIDGIAVVADPANKVEDLTKDQLVSIYTGETKNWSEVGGDDQAIVVVGREAGSGTRDGFESITGTKDSCKYRQELTSTGDVITTVAGNPNAIGYASLASIKDTVKAISVNGVAPSEATVSDGSYEVQRPFVLVTKEGVELSKAAQLFFDYATGKDAADIISAAGAVPVAK